MSDLAEQPFKLLLYGYDTVECSYYLRAPSGQGIDFERLGVEKEALRQGKSKDPKPVKIGGVDFLLQRYGSSSGFPFVLSNAELTIECGEYNNPSFYVTYRSEALWRESAAVLHQRFLDWATALGFREYRGHTLSRVDFTFDYFLAVVDFDENSFVTLSAKDSKYRHERKLQTVTFGQSDIVLRVYDKVAEILEKSLKVWFFDLWERKDRVWRIEWQVRKDPLRRFGIRSFTDLDDQQGDLLRYLAHEHDTLRIPSEDSNRSRWPLHPLWMDLQQKIETLNSQGIYREIDPEALIGERLMRIAISIYGNLKQVAALHCLREGKPMLSNPETLLRLQTLLRQLHDPLTWRADVEKRVIQMRLGQW